MKDISNEISFLVREHFPSFYEEDGKILVDLVQGYYEFLEQHDNTLEVARNLFTNRDVDTAGEEYITHFREKYLNKFPKLANLDDVFLIKNIQDIYKSKGSEQSLSTLMQLIFNEESTVEYPSEKVLRPSSAQFIKPRYLEIEVADINRSYINKEIVGKDSGARAFVEGIARIRSKTNTIIDVAFLSNVRGIFQTGELISDNSLDASESPKIIGSLTTFTITNGGADNNVGDEYDIISTTGFRGKARVTAVADQSGRVSFTLEDGGSGYTLSSALLSDNVTPLTKVIVSENVLLPTLEGLIKIANKDEEDQYDGTYTDKYFTTWTKLTEDAERAAAGAGTGLDVAGNSISSNYDVDQSGIFDINDVELMRNVRDGTRTYESLNSTFKSYIENNYILSDIPNLGLDQYIQQYDTVQLPYWELGIEESVDEFPIGTEVEVYESAGGAQIANAAVVSLGANSLIVSIKSSNTPTSSIGGASAASSGYVQVSGNTAANATVIFTGGVDRSIKTANVTGLNTSAIGIHGYSSNVYANNSFFKVIDVDDTVKAYGTIANSSTGSGATFQIGSLTDTENLSIATDLVNGLNSLDIRYIDIPYTPDSFDSLNQTQSIAICGLAPSTDRDDQVANGVFQDVYLQSGGTGYANTDTITVDSTKYANGATVPVSERGAGLQLQLDSVDSETGAITQVTLVNGGTTGYSYIPEITVTSLGGSNAVIVPLMGYGLTQLPVGNLDTIIDECLSLFNGQIGTIASLSGINPGSNYNFDPFIIVNNPFISAYNRKNLVIGIENQTGTFLEGESVTQTLTINAPTLTLGSNVAGANYLIGEGIIQTGTAAIGKVESWDSDNKLLKLSTLSGVFDASNNITGSVSGTEYTVDSINNSTTIQTVAKGTVVSSRLTNDEGTESKLTLRRSSFNVGFERGIPITGTTSEASGDITSVSQDEDSRAMGDNAIVTAEAYVALNVATGIDIVDSGIGYKDGETVTLSRADNPTVITGVIGVTTSGEQEGYWATERHFTSSDVSIIQDNDYYQEYSYSIRSGASFEVYEQIIKDLIHVAGTKLFGETFKISENESLTSLLSSIQNYEYVYNTVGSTSADTNQIVLDSTTGLANGMIVSGSYTTTQSRTIQTNVALGSNTIVLDNVDNIGSSNRNELGGLYTESAGWYDPYIISGTGFAADTVITEIDRDTNTVHFQNQTTAAISSGATITITGVGSIPVDTSITDINTGTDTITISVNTEGTIPDSTPLTFIGPIND